MRLGVCLLILMFTLGLFNAVAFGTASSTTKTADQWVVPGTAPEDEVLGNQFLFRLREGAGKLTKTQRAAWVNQRLVTVLQFTDLKSSDINWRKAGSCIAITVRGKDMITVTTNDAKAVGSSVADLAKSWVAQLQRTLPEICKLPTQREGPRT